MLIVIPELSVGGDGGYFVKGILEVGGLGFLELLEPKGEAIG